MIDLIFREHRLEPSEMEFTHFNPIMITLEQLLYEGMEMILKNEFKSKWLATFVEILRTENILARVFNKFLAKDRK